MIEETLQLVETRTDEELEKIAQKLYEIVRQEGVTLREAERIYGMAGTTTRNQPETRALYDAWRNKIIM